MLGRFLREIRELGLIACEMRDLGDRPLEKEIHNIRLALARAADIFTKQNGPVLGGGDTVPQVVELPRRRGLGRKNNQNNYTGSGWWQSAVDRAK